MGKALFDQNAWLKRIGYTGPLEPTLVALHGLILAHAHAIASLDIGPNRTRITIFNARLTVRHATGESERRLLKDEAEFRSVLRGDFGLNMSDDEIRTCISVMGRKGEKGAPHPFFA